MSDKIKGEHTKGPWEVNGSLVVKDCYSEVICDTDVSINFAPKRYVSSETSKANARLIAAAPDMLEALGLARATIERLVKHGGSALSVQGTFDVVDKAIAKAEGRA